MRVPASAESIPALATGLRGLAMFPASYSGTIAVEIGVGWVLSALLKAISQLQTVLVATETVSGLVGIVAIVQIRNRSR